MANYQVNITLSDATLQGLKLGGYSLIVFKGAQGPSDLVSTVWFSRKSLGYKTSISWKAEYNIYISDSQFKNGATIGVTSQKPMTAGQIATVTDYNGLNITAGNTDEYQISNYTGKAMNCGLASVGPNGVGAPICCSALYGNFTAGMKPVEKVFLCFSNRLTQVGAVWTMTTSSGYVVDVTDPTMNGVTVAFDINTGWSCPDDAQALNCDPIPSGSAFAKFLNSVFTAPED